MAMLTQGTYQAEPFTETNRKFAVVPPLLILEPPQIFDVQILIWDSEEGQIFFWADLHTNKRRWKRNPRYAQNSC